MSIKGSLGIEHGSVQKAFYKNYPIHWQAISLTVDSQNQKVGVVTLNYLVSGCGWSPKYSIHGSLNKADFEVKYGAMVRQETGENWDRVRLVLSTSSPRISAAGPSLNPFRITLGESKAVRGSTDPFAEDAQVSLQTLRNRRSRFE